MNPIFSAVAMMALGAPLLALAVSIPPIPGTGLKVKPKSLVHGADELPGQHAGHMLPEAQVALQMVAPGTAVGAGLKTLVTFSKAPKPRAAKVAAGAQSGLTGGRSTPTAAAVHGNVGTAVAVAGASGTPHRPLLSLTGVSAEGTNGAKAKGATLGMSAGWFLCILVAILTPTLVMAGCISLSNQVNSPGLVATVMAAVLGKVTVRRPGRAGAEPHAAPPSSSSTCKGAGSVHTASAQATADRPRGGPPPAREPRESRSARSAFGSLSARAPPHEEATEATQYRQWEDTRPAPHMRQQDPTLTQGTAANGKRVNFARAPSFAASSPGSSKSGITIATPGTPVWGSRSAPNVPSAAFANVPGPRLGSPPRTPLYCEPALGSHTGGKRTGHVQAQAGSLPGGA